jgi:transcriptional regulator with XRE-family HTH domain
MSFRHVESKNCQQFVNKCAFLAERIGKVMTTPEDYSLIKLRKALGIGQSEMAKRMGLSLRPYQELESKARSVRFRHILLAESVALDIAIEKQNLELVPANVRKKVVKLALMLVLQNLKEKPLKIAESIVGPVEK